MLKVFAQPIKRKGPQTVFRLLALLLLMLAMAETPLGTGMVFAEEQTRTAQRSRELMSRDLPARHALPERAAVEITAGQGHHATASQTSGGSDAPALEIPGSGMPAAENGAAWAPSARSHCVAAPTDRASARGPPPTA